MSAIARYYNFKGLKVSGYDKTPSELTHALESEGIEVHYEDNIDFIPKDVDDTLVVYTPAIPKDMGELVYVQEHGYRVIKRSRMLGDIAEAVAYSTAWLFGETPFQLTLSDGDWCYDSEGNIMRELWECTVTMTNTGTGESVSEPNVVIPLTFDPASA